MKTIVFKDEFEKELKRLGVKQRFVANLVIRAKESGMSLEKAVELRNLNSRLWCFISGAFSWIDTKEGHNFWAEVAYGNKPKKT